MRFKGLMTLPVYFEKKESTAHLLSEDQFDEDDYTVEPIDFFTIDYMYEMFYDKERKIFKYTVIGVAGETFCTTKRRSQIIELIKLSKDYE